MLLSFRTVVITNHCKCSYKNDYLVIKDEQIRMIHISEINTVIFETPAVSITGVLLSELAKNKVGILFCDERHLPQGHYVPFSANYMSSSRIITQAQWNCVMKDLIWREIVRLKILKQSDVLKYFDKLKESEMLRRYSDDIAEGDSTNREGFAAKVYFNALFGMDFSRGDSSIPYNACLDYGYAILLAIVAREIVNAGYEMALGIHHRGMFNPNNLACDVMEPFRPIVDFIVLSNYKNTFNREMKTHLWNLGNSEIIFREERSFLNSVIGTFFREICRMFDNKVGFLPEYNFIW